MRICVENSTWNNVGDGFYQAALQAFLQDALVEHQVSMMDGPVARAFRPGEKFEPHAFDSSQYCDADLYVFSGPILNGAFFPYYSDFISRIVAAGKRYAMISVHGSRRGPITASIREFLVKYPPAFFCTRDPLTTALYGDLGFNHYDGICFAFCVPELGVPELKFGRPTVAVSMYAALEPEIKFARAGSVSDVRLTPVDKARMWNVRRHLQWLRPRPAEVDGVLLVRPIHDIGYRFPHLNFASPNSYLSYNPLGYLAIYKAVDATITDRVHAAVASLAFGKPVHYLGSDPRDSIFDRPSIFKRESGMLHSALSDMKTWIKASI
jgi:hypothetical protein